MFRDLVHEEANAVFRLDSQPMQKSPNRVACPADVVIGEFLLGAGRAFPEEGQLVAFALKANPVRAVPADIEGITRLIAKFLLGNRPIEVFQPFLIRSDVSHLASFINGVEAKKRDYSGFFLKVKGRLGLRKQFFFRRQASLGVGPVAALPRPCSRPGRCARAGSPFAAPPLLDFPALRKKNCLRVPAPS